MPWLSSANQDFAYPQVFLWWSVFADVDQLILDYQQQELQKEAAFTLWFLCVFFLSVAKKSHSYDFESPPNSLPFFVYCCCYGNCYVLDFFLQSANTVK